jgi:[FeFe] hydrogenase H-cluster maturation GTPase HydF
MRPHIILLGRRNVGKSSLVNALCESELALVSNVPGTTTDPVRKGFELLPFGPVVFVDTGGVDDTGELGELRVKRTRRELKKADFALLVVESGVWDDYEQTLFQQLEAAKTPFLVVVNKTDVDDSWRAPVDGAWYVSALKGENTRELRAELAGRLRELVKRESTIVGDLVTAGDLVVLVVPIDLEAPAGRLILPQVMTIRDLLDNDAVALVVKERELYATLSTLGRRPDLVITDSQAVLKVSGDVEPEIPLTTFSILFARLKGDLHELARGVKVIDELRDGDRVLIAEACSHHPVGDDIGRVKIPRWIRQYTGVDVEFVNVQGREYPENLDDYSLIIHCGACMLTPKAMESRMDEAAGRSVPITNYGVTISYVQGVLERVIAPFGLTLEDL